MLINPNVLHQQMVWETKDGSLIPVLVVVTDLETDCMAEGFDSSRLDDLLLAAQTYLSGQGVVASVRIVPKG
jgi:hypothetical protein